MKTTTLAFVLAVFSSTGIAQSYPDSLKAKVDTTAVHKFVETQPKFKGGANAMMQYLVNNIRFPAGARTGGKFGDVFVDFVVRRNGKVSDAVVSKSSGPKDLDREAVRVISGMPDWEPATLVGVPVHCKVTFPVKFNQPVIIRR